MTCKVGDAKCPSAAKCPIGSIFLPTNPIGSCFNCKPIASFPTGFYCVNGSIALCPAGSFCPNVTATYPHQCPEGFLCRDGYAAPVECDSLSSCPAGSGSKLPGVGFLGILVAMIITTIAALWLISFYRKRRSRIAVSDSERRKQVSIAFAEVVQSITGSPLESETLLGFNEKIRYSSAVSIEFNNLGLKLKSSGELVLDGVTGEFPAGSLVAVMGGSGAGKSSFMSALADRAPYGEILGEVTLNGVPGDNIGKYPRLVAFVPQDDILHEDLTVYENLLFSARLRLPPTIPLEQQKAIVEDVLQILDLEKIRNKVVGSPDKRGISGGQKKRVNIGVELVAYPRILFLDEPTSGLDSASSLQVARCLQRMRSLGITVVAVIHQPRWSVFRSFSHCLLLARGGKPVYLGLTRTIQGYFEALGFALPAGENVADWFIDIVSGQCTRHLEEGVVDRDFNPLRDLPNIWKERGISVLDNVLHEKKRLTRFGTRPFVSEGDAINFELESALNLDGDAELAPHDIERICSVNGIDASREIAASLYEQFRNNIPSEDPVTIKTLSKFFLKSVKSDSARLSMRVLFEQASMENRPLASFFSQLFTFANRHLAKFNAVDVTFKCIFAAFGAAICALSARGVLNYTTLPIASQTGLLVFAIVIAASFMYVFGDERLTFSRESQTGMSITAYWLSKNLVNFGDILLVSIYYYTFYFAVFQADYSYGDGFSVFLLLGWYCSGVAHFFSVTMGPANGLLVAVMLPAIELCVLSGITSPVPTASAFQKFLYYIGIGLYAVEDLTVIEVNALPKNVQQTPYVKDMMKTFDYSDSHLVRNAVISFLLGLLIRFLTLAVLLIKVHGFPGQALFNRFKTRFANAFAF